MVQPTKNMCHASPNEIASEWDEEAKGGLGGAIFLDGPSTAVSTSELVPVYKPCPRSYHVLT